ncbi:MAG: hypothetical protein V4714_08505 [Bacteroidota bacterium]
MEWNKVEDLVSKYWEGETSVEEENELKRIFTQCDPNSLPQSLQEVAVLFRYYAAESEKNPLGEAFDDKLLQQLKARPVNSHTGRKVFYLNLLKLTACLALVVLATLFFSYEHRKAEAQRQLAELGTYDNPQRAYEETKKALLLVSAQLNKGKAYAGEIKKISEAEEIVRQSQR